MLKLVRTEPLPVATEVPAPQVPEAGHAARILNPQLLSRLADLNQAARIMRATGYRVLSEKLGTSNSDRSIVQIERTAQTPIARILDCTQHFWRDDPKTGKRFGVAWFWGGVQVVWEEL